MSTQLHFRKLHGIGNDFILVDADQQSVNRSTLLAPELAVRICDRNRGIGADGLIVMLPAPNAESDRQMVVLNADGSRPQMCGNGIRCAAKLLIDHCPDLSGRSQLRIHTDAGIKVCDILPGDAPGITNIKVAMGAPTLKRKAIPMVGDGEFILQPIEVAGEQVTATAVNMGNPHLITFVGEGESPEYLARNIGPLLERHDFFPERTNVEFAQLHNDEIVLWVWERGVGITQACGTGACATAVAAIVTSHIKPGKPVRIKLPGGPLIIDVAEDLSQVWMTGPAEEVFQGTYRL